MSERDSDRLISASEVERWSYCPLSWYLERKDSFEDIVPLQNGIKEHEMVGRKAKDIENRERSTAESRSLSLTSLSFALVIFSMSLLLLLLTNIGFLRGTIWQVVVIIGALILVMVSVSMYLMRSLDSTSGSRKRIWDMFKRMERSNKVGGFFPFISYLFGILLLMNGVVLLRPLGIPDDTIVSFFTISLLVLYLILLVSLLIFFIRARKRGYTGDIKVGFPMTMVLVIGLSVLFIMFSDEVDPEGQFGWIFLITALIWFIGALFYDAIKGFRNRSKKPDKVKKEDLPMTTIALMASVFMAMSFLVRGENLQDYSTLSIVMAGLWVAGAVFFFIKGTSDQRTAHKEKAELDLPERSRIVSVDDLGGKNRGKPMVSKKHFLVGSPDILIEEEGKKIPVEVKTGKAPFKPHLSHIMQVSAYLVLVDVNFNQETPHGYIDYVSRGNSRNRHKVEWDMLTKALVLSKVSEIRDAERSDEAHRDHNRDGKCRNCSRRMECPERLV